MSYIKHIIFINSRGRLERRSIPKARLICSIWDRRLSRDIY